MTSADLLKILIVDDNPANRFSLDKLLKRHELGQPLQAISGYAELLGLILQKEQCAPEVNEKLPKILEQIDRVSLIHRKLMQTTHSKTKEYGKGGQIIDMD